MKAKYIYIFKANKKDKRTWHKKSRQMGWYHSREH